ncbi:hypothetical protein [Bhargavaea ginsengi]|uniref:hypothetical protein n=1 Tax=Bhargavaea ginsengi TaxID=426757 RepID=UPI003C7954C5
MTEEAKTKFEVKQLRREVDDLQGRVRVIEEFRAKTVENIKEILKLIDELKNADVWMRRMMTSTLVGGIVSMLTGVIVWLVQK